MANTYLLAIGIIVFVIIAVVWVLLRRKKEPEPEIYANPEIMDEIKESRKCGMNDIQIKNALIRHGWKRDDIDAALHKDAVEGKKSED